ncbi:di-trans,poly-cis-decaprenylcistransferase [Candidatus Dependentiae bacterium]|nr:di-trans,poly-cis-decaprenylcistransferase [Candidatus Dependentiae bacterium]
MMKHLAIIMDGNRRWARSKGLGSLIGHSNGFEAAKRAVEFCLKKKIAYLSLYTFSIENFKRSEHERSYLFDLLASKAPQLVDDFLKYGVRARFIGDRSLFPAQLLSTIENLESQTNQGHNLQVNFLFCYGARQEIIQGVKSIIQKIKNGELSENDITDETLNNSLWTAGIPEPDMIIRTGGTKRMSNFLLYQAAYSEFYFLDCFWPEITEDHLQAACLNFEESKRNFGT